MGGAASVLTARRALGLAGLLVLLVVWCALAPRLPELGEGADVAFLALVVFPAFAATIWLALPLARVDSKTLLAATALAGATAVLLGVLELESGANVAKLVAYTLGGLAFLSFFEELWWIALVALLVPWVDIWSVVAGPTEYVVEEQPAIFEHVAVALPAPGDGLVVNIGPPDVLFFALFLGAAERFGLRTRLTWISMTACLATTLVLVWAWDDIAGVPALPAVCIGFLLPNADLLWRAARAARSRPEAP